MKIQNDVNLKNYNTFKVASMAKYFCEIKSEDDILELINSEIYQENKRFFLGSGANTIFVNDFDGIIIKNEILGKETIQEDENKIKVKVGAGENRNDFVTRCANKNFVGIENLAYIPSSVGATAVQNIGAYGVEAKDTIESVKGVNLETKQTAILSNKECNFGYRESVFKNELKNKFIITHVTFELKKFKNNDEYKFNCEYSGISEKITELGFDKNKISPIQFVKVITEIRKNKLPDWEKIGTAGSFFKNPVISEKKRKDIEFAFGELKGFPVADGIKLSAGQLIDMCGFKGQNNGKVGTYKTHALVLVNEGPATGKDVINFANQIQERVKNKFGIDLEPEAIFVE